MASFTLNGKPVKVAGDAQSMLLWALRDEVGLTGKRLTHMPFTPDRVLATLKA